MSNTIVDISRKKKPKIPIGYKISMKEWLEMSQAEVIDRFSSLPRAIVGGSDDTAFAYLPGTRDDRVLLVAHSDTVWGPDAGRINISYSDGVYFSGDTPTRSFLEKAGRVFLNKYGIGIGADDRAGCAALWELKDLGHSLLITSGEEMGCAGSNALMKDRIMSHEIDHHNFVVQLDRQGDDDLVFYDVATKEFKAYCVANTGYSPSWGTFTDICELCETICGVNISTGYYNEHSSDEYLVEKEWENTVRTVKKWLSKKDLPYFELSVVDDDLDDDEYDIYDDSQLFDWPPYNSSNSDNDKQIIDSSMSDDDILECPHCDYVMTSFELEQNGYVCLACSHFLR